MASQIIKRSAEVRTPQISFELMPEVVNGGTISAIVAVTAALITPAGGTNTLVIGSTSIATGSKMVNVQISGGANGDVYWVTCKVTVSGSTLESIAIVKISDSPIGYVE